MTITTIPRPTLIPTQQPDRNSERPSAQVIELEVPVGAGAVDLRPYVFGRSIRMWAVVSIALALACLLAYLVDARGFVVVLAELALFALLMTAFHVLRFILTTPDGYERGVRPRRPARIWS